MNEKIKQRSPFLPPITPIRQQKSKELIGLLPPMPVEIIKHIEFDSREDKK